MLTVVAGPPGSGKSTLAGQISSRVFEFKSWVQARYEAPIAHASAAYRQDYARASTAYLEAVCSAAAEGDLALADLFVLRTDRLRALDCFRAKGIAPLRLAYLCVPLDVLLRRAAARHYTPKGLRTVADYWRIQEIPRRNEGWDSIQLIAST